MSEHIANSAKNFIPEKNIQYFFSRDLDGEKNIRVPMDYKTRLTTKMEKPKPKKEPETFKGLDTYTLQIIKSYIDKNIAKNINLDELSKTVNLSKFYFCRRFKKTMGLPPHQYIINCRIAMAKKILIETRRPITDIAFDIGYDNLSNFIRTFGKMTSLTPRKYREKFRKNT